MRNKVGMYLHVFCIYKKPISTVEGLTLNLPSTETSLPRVACWGSGDSGLHPWWLCVLLYLPLSPPANAHIPGHADLCIWETIPALLLYCRAACKNTGPVHSTPRATKTKWAMRSKPANTHIIIWGTYTLTAGAGLSHNTCWISALYITRWACISTFASSDSAANSASTVHTDWLAQSNSEPHICFRITYRSSQEKRIQSVWEAHTARSFYTG